MDNYKAKAAPATVIGECAVNIRHWVGKMPTWEGRPHAMTRKPGDLPYFFSTRLRRGVLGRRKDSLALFCVSRFPQCWSLRLALSSVNNYREVLKTQFSNAPELPRRF
jgi:hypothetical protein